MLSLSKTFLAVTFDSRRLRVLQFSPQRLGSVKILRQAAEPIGPELSVSDPQQLGRFLGDLLARAGIRSRSASFAVGLDAAILHHFTIPAVPDDELASLVRFRISQELPFAIEEGVADYVVTARDEKGLATSLLAAAVKVEHLDYLRHVARAAGLSIRRIGLSSYANLLACQASASLAQGTALFVQLGADAMEIDVFSSDGRLLLSRSAVLPGEEASKGLVDQAMLQLQRTMPVYAADERSEPVAQILVAGGTGFEDELLAQAMGHLGLPGRRFQAAGLPEEPQAGGFSTAYGLALGQLRSRTEQFDFHDPKRAVDPAARRTRTMQLVAAGLLALLVVALVVSNRIQAGKQRDLRELETVREQKDKAFREFRSFANQLGKVKEWRDGRVNWLAELQDLTRRFPPADKAYLTRLRFTENAQRGTRAHLELDGLARSAEIVNELYEELRAGGKYADVKRNQESAAKGASDYPDTFSFTVILGRKGAGSSEPSKPKEKAPPAEGPTVLPTPESPGDL